MRRLLVVLLLLAAVAGCGADNSTGDKGYVSSVGAPTEYQAADRKQAPAISGTTLQGEKVSLRALAAGRPAVLNVWGSWCPPCRKETGVLNAAAEQLGNQAAFLGINVRDPGGTGAPLAFQRRFDVPYPSLYDPDGRTLLGLPRGIGAYTIPSTVVLDPQGRIAATILGPVPTTRTLVDLVQDADK